MLAEVLGIEQCGRRVKICGTDVDDEALRQARLGVYPVKAVEHLPRALVQKYFDRRATGSRSGPTCAGG